MSTADCGAREQTSQSPTALWGPRKKVLARILVYSNFQFAIQAQQKVFGFDVTMNDMASMTISQRARQLRYILQQRIFFFLKKNYDCKKHQHLPVLLCWHESDEFVSTLDTIRHEQHIQESASDFFFGKMWADDHPTTNTTVSPNTLDFCRKNIQTKTKYSDAYRFFFGKIKKKRFFFKIASRTSNETEFRFLVSIDEQLPIHAVGSWTTPASNKKVGLTKFRSAKKSRCVIGSWCLKPNNSPPPATIYTLLMFCHQKSHQKQK